MRVRACRAPSHSPEIVRGEQRASSGAIAAIAIELCSVTCQSSSLYQGDRQSPIVPWRIFIFAESMLTTDINRTPHACHTVDHQRCFMLRVFARMSACILLYADMSFLFYNTCQHTRECMSTCTQNFNMHVNKNCMSTYKNIHVNMQTNACQNAFTFPTCMSKNSTCMSIKMTCHHAFFPRTCTSKKRRMSTRGPFS